MSLVPLFYNSRSLFRRRASTLLTIASIGATVAVLSGVFALQQGFSTLFSDNGREDLAVIMRPGAPAEGLSGIGRERAQLLVKSTPEIATDAEGRPMASAESYLAVRLRKRDGGETNVPIRGVQPMTFDIRAGEFEIVEGRRFEAGNDEVIVGQRLLDRIAGSEVGNDILLNVTPFKIVGVFRCPGPFETEIWGDVERLMEALDRGSFNRIFAKLVDGTDVDAMAQRLEEDRQAPAKVQTERAYLSGQTGSMSFLLGSLGIFLALIMGSAAVFTGTNTMLAAVTARTHEIGILRAIGFRPLAIFTSFLFESVLLGLLGGLLGALLVLPLNGVKTGTGLTFSEVAFAFRVNPPVLISAVLFAMALGVVGGAWPAWRAARLPPTEAMRRG